MSSNCLWITPLLAVAILTGSAPWVVLRAAPVPQTVPGSVDAEPISHSEPSLLANLDSLLPPYRFEKRGAIVYCDRDDGPLKCDIYLPNGPGPFPAVLAVHGGGWFSGSKFMMLRHAWLMAEAGYVVVAINYRHAPRHKFPAQLEDCEAAVRWMRRHANTWRIDPDRIGGFGYSAGGHLVAMLALTDQDEGFTSNLPEELRPYRGELSAALIGGAPGNFEWIPDDSSALKYWLGSTPGEAPEVYRRASPSTYASADDPPCYFFHADWDFVVPIESALALHRRLIQFGIESQFEIARQSDHLSTFSRLEFMRRGIVFLDRHLKMNKPPATDPAVQLP